LLIGRY